MDTLYSIDRRRNFSKTRVNEQEGDITYINEANKVFNKKVWRSFSIRSTVSNVSIILDRTVLQQVHLGDPGQLRKRDRSVSDGQSCRLLSVYASVFMGR